MKAHGIRLVAVGNGTAGRETLGLRPRAPGERGRRRRRSGEGAGRPKRPRDLLVSEAGASVYSASETARKEFPELDVTVRGAISIARRLQDPLAELVKIDPKRHRRGAVPARRGARRCWADAATRWWRAASTGSAWTSTPASPAAAAPVSGHRRRPGEEDRRRPRSATAAFPRASSCWRSPASGRRPSSRRPASCGCAARSTRSTASAVHPERYGVRRAHGRGPRCDAARAGRATRRGRAADATWRATAEDDGARDAEGHPGRAEEARPRPARRLPPAAFREDVRTLEDLRRAWSSKAW